MRKIAICLGKSFVVAGHVISRFRVGVVELRYLDESLRRESWYFKLGRAVKGWDGLAR
jgi:hypothetical protein